MSQQGILGDVTSPNADIETLTGNVGGPVGPDGAFNVNVVGSAPITTSGNPGTNTLTIDTDGSVATTYSTDLGSATPSSDNLNVFGDLPQGSLTSGAGDTITITNSNSTTIQRGVIRTATDGQTLTGVLTDRAVTPSSLSAKLGSQTNRGVPFGNGSSMEMGWTNALTDGQLIIGNTGSDPAAANLTSTDSSVTITNGASSIDLSVPSGPAEKIIFEVVKGSPGTINPFQAIYLSGFNNGMGLSEVELAQSNSPSTMPCIGLAIDTITNSTSGNVICIGRLDGIDTSSFSILDQLYISSSTAGALTPTRPTGATNLIQVIGEVARVNPSNGVMEVFGGGILTRTPNTSQNNAIIGDSNNQPLNTPFVNGIGSSWTITPGTSITLDVTGGGLTWTEITGTSQALLVNNGYIANNAGLVTLTLPATAVIGDIIKIDGKGTGGWNIAQNAGQTIHFLGQDTTTGGGGSLASTTRYDCVTLRCFTANTDWIVESLGGNLTVV